MKVKLLSSLTFHFDHPPRPYLPSPLFVCIRAVVVVVDVVAVVVVDVVAVVVVVDAVVVAIAAAIDNVASFLSLLQMLWL